MNIRATFEADAKAAEGVNPCVSSLDDPTYFAQATAVRNTAFGDGGQNAVSVKESTIFVKIVPAICEDAPWFGYRSPQAAGDRGNGLDQRQ